MNPAPPLSEEHLATLNPGIRYTVQKLREWGFDTRDSGDGKTHDHACDLPIPYVHISIHDPAHLHHDLRTLMELMEGEGITVGMCDETGENPSIEGCILADMSAWIHLFNVVIPGNSTVLPPLPPATEAKGCEGVESRVCADIAARQRLGITKYGCTVEQSPDDMLQHAYEEALDLAVYLKAEIERRVK